MTLVTLKDVLSALEEGYAVTGMVTLAEDMRALSRLQKKKCPYCYRPVRCRSHTPLPILGKCFVFGRKHLCSVVAHRIMDTQKRM